MFARISGRYDLANHLLSGCVDRVWRRQLVRAVHDVAPREVLDLATGSGDVAFALMEGLQPGAAVVGMDFCQPMLDQAVRKRAANPRWAAVDFRQGDGMALPLAHASFDAVTIAFGLRNMANRHHSLTEMHRVLRPGGHLFVLEFSQPFPWFRPIYFAYLKLILPPLAAVVTGDRSAYEYLGGTIEQFPGRAAMSAEIGRAGFTVLRAVPMTFGIVALHVARK